LIFNTNNYLQKNWRKKKKYSMIISFSFKLPCPSLALSLINLNKMTMKRFAYWAMVWRPASRTSSHSPPSESPLDTEHDRNVNICTNYQQKTWQQIYSQKQTVTTLWLYSFLQKTRCSWYLQLNHLKTYGKNKCWNHCLILVQPIKALFLSSIILLLFKKGWNKSVN